MELKQLIVDLCLENPSSRIINEFVFLCRKIALVQIRRKLNSGRLHSEFFKSSPDDLAIDCIADLFQQDDSGTFVQIKIYFESLSLDNISEKDLLTHLRRLVFARVNQSIFRMYNEADPSLGKILRNIKLAVQGLRNFQEAERFGEQCIAPSACETLEHLPELDRQELERQLRYYARGSEHIPALLAKLSVYLREQNDHSRIVPIMLVAMVFRSLYSDVPIMQEVILEDRFIAGDASAILHDICKQLMNETEPKYVGRRKIDAFVFKKYFDVIEENLNATIIQQNGERLSFFTSLKSLMPEITEKDYKKNHKSRVEYLARIAHKRAVKELRKHV
jgi:hypothetical protein